MAKIELKLAHSYKPNPQVDADYALQPLDMTFDDGGAYALLGPSGCGKSTMLNVISGLVEPSEGHVLFDGQDVTGLTPQARNIAQVFQFPVIYDTMTVGQNLAFPLRNRGVEKSLITERVNVISEMLGLSSQLDQRAEGLSADAKQKISLGRGLVRDDVSAILFDEPLTVIDPHLKWQLRRKLKEIHHELKLTLIYVTHDQIEALTFADRVAVMSHGKAVQVGTPQELFELPAHTFVGHFIGSPGMNFLPIVVHDSTRIDVLGQTLQWHDTQSKTHATLPAGELTLGIRPEYLSITKQGASNTLSVQIKKIQDLGTYFLVGATIGSHHLKLRLAVDEVLPEVGQTVGLNVINSRTCFYKNEVLVA